MDIEKTKTLVFLSVVSVLIFTSLASSTSVYAQDSSNMQMPTDKGTLEVVLSIDPFPPELRKPVKINLEFINPSTNNPQSHVDYRATIVQDGQGMFTTYQQHTHSGKDSFSYAFMVEDEYQLEVSLEGIDFSPIPKETAIFPLMIGEKNQKEITVELESGIVSGEGPDSNEPKTAIPEWIKQVAEFWIANQIEDSGFVQVIEYLVKEGIISIPNAETPEGGAATQIPAWIKTNAEFWVNGDISNDEFAVGLEWLINNGIIRVQDAAERTVDSYKIEGNYYPIRQFKMTPTSPDCPGYHLHATSGYTIDAALVSFTDHNPGACGIGMTDELILEHPAMTENQILAWQKATGIILEE